MVLNPYESPTPESVAHPSSKIPWKFVCLFGAPVALWGAGGSFCLSFLTVEAEDLGAQILFAICGLLMTTGGVALLIGGAGWAWTARTKTQAK